MSDFRYYTDLHETDYVANLYYFVFYLLIKIKYQYFKAVAINYQVTDSCYCKR